MGVLWASNFNYQMNTCLKRDNYYTRAHSLHHLGQLLYFNTPVLTSLNIETAGKLFLCFMWNMSVLPGGYAGDLLQWLPQSEPADGFSPMKKTQQASFKKHSGLWFVFSSKLHLTLCWNRVQSAQSIRLVTKSFVRMSCVRIPDNQEGGRSYTTCRLSGAGQIQMIHLHFPCKGSFFLLVKSWHISCKTKTSK